MEVKSVDRVVIPLKKEEAKGQKGPSARHRDRQKKKKKKEGRVDIRV